MSKGTIFIENGITGVGRNAKSAVRLDLPI